jgi:hypothetical protein
MRRVKLMLPDALYDRVQALAAKNRVSIDALVATALAEKLLAPRTEGYAVEQTRKVTASENEQGTVH